MKIILLCCFFTLINCWINVNSIVKSTLNIINLPSTTVYYKSLPDKENNKNVTFVVWTGYKINPKHYERFISNIQTIGIQKKLNIEAIVSKECKLPKDKKDIYLFGHSSGGYRTLLEPNQNIKSKIVYGATHNLKSKLYFGIGKIIPRFNIKTLTILGEFDKYIDILHIRDEPKHANHYNIIAKNNYHLSVSNGNTNCLMSLFDNDNNKYNDEKLCLDIANICVEFILLNENEINCLDYYCNKSDRILNITKTIHQKDKNIFVNYLVLKLYTNFKHFRYYNFYNFILSKSFFNNINSYVDLNHIWLKTNKPTLDIDILNSVYNKSLLKKKVKIQIIRHFNILSWIFAKCYHKSNKIYVHHFNFLSLNYYKLPSMYYIFLQFR